MRKILDEHSEEIFNFVVIAIISIVILAAIIISNKKDEERWNNGYCQCGGQLVYEQAVGHYNQTAYIYKCNKCDRRYEFNRIR